MEIEEIIEEKIKLIQETTGNQVIIQENNTVGACINWPDWHDKAQLPKILHCNSINKVHILHELIHLEKFFINEYSLILCSNPSFHKITNPFKNFPEDYVAHKTIKYDYKFNPINKDWFRGKDNIINLPDEEIINNLVNFYTFCEFCPEYKSQLKFFEQKCKRQKTKSYLIAQEAIKALTDMNYEEKNDYNECVEKIIKIFVPDLYRENKIYPGFLYKRGNLWYWNPKYYSPTT